MKKQAVCFKYLGTMFSDNPDKDEKRTEAHQELLEVFDYEEGTIKEITDNLDLWIELPLSTEKVSTVSIMEMAKDLVSILDSDDVRNGGWSYIHEKTAKLRKEYWDK